MLVARRRAEQRADLRYDDRRRQMLLSGRFGPGCRTDHGAVSGAAPSRHRQRRAAVRNPLARRHHAPERRSARRKDRRRRSEESGRGLRRGLPPALATPALVIERGKPEKRGQTPIFGYRCLSPISDQLPAARFLLSPALETTARRRAGATGLTR